MSEHTLYSQHADKHTHTPQNEWSSDNINNHSYDDDDDIDVRVRFV